MVNRYNSEIHHRRSIRLKGYDYSQAGAYFITICAHNRQCLFGEIDDMEMVLNELGEIVRDEWLKSSEIRTEIQLGEYVIMPNHFHGIVIFNENIGITVGAISADVGAIHELPLHHCLQHHESPPRRQQRRGMALPKIIGRFKMISAKRLNILRDITGVPVWQGNYYEHIIRDEADYNRIAEYIADNPRRWRDDLLRPDNFVTGT